MSFSSCLSVAACCSTLRCVTACLLRLLLQLQAMVRRFRYVYVPRMHLHDAPGYRSRLTFVFKELDVKAGNVCRTESLNGALAIDMLMQAAGQPPANFDRAEQRAQVGCEGFL